MTDKGKILTFPDTAAVEAEAAAWVARFDAGDVSAKDQAAFQAWLNRSALHRAAIAEYGTLWSEFDGLRPLTEPDDAGRTAGARDDRPSLLKRGRPWLAACAAAVTAIAFVGAAVLFHAEPALLDSAPTKPPARHFYETAVGGHKRIVLADGSSVILNTDSRLAVDFSGKRRDIHLMRGEAYFDVVHDAARPFTVRARNYLVRDIGTAFDVHLSKAGTVEVGVTKGRVEVMPAEGAHISGAAKSVGVVAGHKVVLGEKITQVEAVPRAIMRRQLAWRQGELIYTGQPLGEVLADISRYSDIKIDLADPALANLPVGGAFRTDQIEAIFAALESNFGLQSQWTDPKHVRLTAGHPMPVAGD